jgi:hypothetical protein
MATIARRELLIAALAGSAAWPLVARASPRHEAQSSLGEEEPSRKREFGAVSICPGSRPK